MEQLLIDYPIASALIIVTVYLGVFYANEKFRSVANESDFGLITLKDAKAQTQPFAEFVLNICGQIFAWAYSVAVYQSEREGFLHGLALFMFGLITIPMVFNLSNVLFVIATNSAKFDSPETLAPLPREQFFKYSAYGTVFNQLLPLLGVFALTGSIVILGGAAGSGAYAFGQLANSRRGTAPATKAKSPFHVQALLVVCAILMFYWLLSALRVMEFDLSIIAMITLAFCSIVAIRGVGTKANWGPRFTIAFISVSLLAIWAQALAPGIELTSRWEALIIATLAFWVFTVVGFNTRETRAYFAQ